MKSMIAIVILDGGPLPPDQCKQDVAGLHCGHDHFAEVVTWLDGVNIREDLVTSESLG
jgi:hypothetical protein